MADNGSAVVMVSSTQFLHTLFVSQALQLTQALL